MGGTILGVPIIRTIVYWGLSWGPLILGNYQIEIIEVRWTPHPVIVTIVDNTDYIRVLL